MRQWRALHAAWLVRDASRRAHDLGKFALKGGRPAR
jgi:hypothetical protein